ncbi:MAG: glycosyltransferase family 4 protein [Opitutaceae bacterium]|nr:glycosyltransferase family 4 protein [Opitutaceae bacterium]
MILLSHPTGSTPARHAALGLHRAGLLSEFWTGEIPAASTWITRMLPGGGRQNPESRAFPPELDDKIRTRPLHAATQSFAQRLGLSRQRAKGEETDHDEAAFRMLDRSVAKRISSGNFSGIYAYEDGAESAFRAARDLQELCIYDKPTIHWRAARELLREEAEREPQWAETLVEPQACDEVCARRDTEIALADVIIVPSVFAKHTIEQHVPTRARIAVVPFGPPTHPPAIAEKTRDASQKLRVLFLGPLTQRRGLSYLFAAVQQLEGAAELTVAGNRPIRPCSALDQELSRVNFAKADSQEEILQLMSKHDVLVLPSLFEDFGTELLDAMALGLPVIATPNSAAPDLVSDGNEGFIVPIRSAQAIAEKLHLLIREPGQLAEMSHRAALRAREFNWKRYETTLATRVSETLAIAGMGTCSSYSRATPAPHLPGVVPLDQGR